MFWVLSLIFFPSLIVFENFVINDMSGREVVRLESVSPVQTIDISSLTSGSYIMAITTPEGVSVKKVVVQ